jgi:hydroxymethylbilane synthase
MNPSVTIGTRGSKLALWQAEWVKSLLLGKHPQISVRVHIIKTRGDKVLDVPLAKVGGKGLFVKEIEQALLSGGVDIAVHSMKDMPGEIPDGLQITAIPRRETPHDVLISSGGRKLDELPAGSRIGTSSLRRSAQLLALRPDLTIVPLRGNLNTRLKKLDTGQMDAIVLAAAGVKRLGLAARITEVFDEQVMLPAVGQGALCIETRAADEATLSLVAPLDDHTTHTVVTGERAFLNRLQGGCQVPVAAHGKLDDNRFTLQGLVASLDGRTVIRDQLAGPARSSRQVGLDLAERLLAAGADVILESIMTHDS